MLQEIFAFVFSVAALAGVLCCFPGMRDAKASGRHPHLRK
jgi:hypothetical protein